MIDDENIISDSVYTGFIREVFIDPIRTAVVVDDEYPTMIDLLGVTIDSDGVQGALSEEKKVNAGNVRKIIDFCRAQTPTPWLVDVHDGKSPNLDREQNMADHFDHTDLLILDYHLDRMSGSEKSIQILRRLAANGHFNLVAVYTRNREGAGDGVQRTLTEIALSLVYPDITLELSEKSKKHPVNMLEEWGYFDPDIFERLLDALDEVAFLRILERGKAEWDLVKDFKELNALAALLETIPPTVKVRPAQLFRYLLSQKQSKLKERMATNQFGRVTFGFDQVGCNWIRTDSLFVTVISKQHDASRIPEKLLAALVAWDPIPHRLIMSKMRSELSLKGGIAESNALRNRHLQAAWLDDILAREQPARKTNVRLDVARHWESLGGNIWPGVLDFSDRLTEFLATSERSSLVERFDKFGARNEQEKVYLQINSYVSSKQTEGHHLSTGHVYQTGSKECDYQYWLCLTPACDLEPGQGADAGWKKRLGSWMPLKVVRLFLLKDKQQALREANRGHYIFLQINGDVQVFGFADSGSSTESIPTLRWEQAFAKNFGNFRDNSMIDVAALSAGDTLEFDEHEALVVGQLRYEYAISLLNRLGAHLSRVGLDFRSQPLLS